MLHHDIAERLLKLALISNQSINQSINQSTIALVMHPLMQYCLLKKHHNNLPKSDGTSLNMSSVAFAGAVSLASNTTDFLVFL